MDTMKKAAKANDKVLDSSNFDTIKISLASPEQIRAWSYGEVTKAETINYRSQKPERDGLFCEKIFGPTKDWECHCGKYKKVKFEGIVCDKCGVEITRAKVRRERMGHIEFAAPVSHIWYFKGTPSRISIILDMSPKDVEAVLYFSRYVVIEPGDSPLARKDLLTDKQYREWEFAEGFRGGIGAEAIQELLREIDLDSLHAELKEQVKEATGQKKTKLLRRLGVVEDFRNSGNKPEWMILNAIPVIPPEIRPMVQLDGGRYATSDLNDLYRRVINRNNRLKKLLQLSIAPDIIVNNEKRMLQEAVDSLIDNGRRGRPVLGPGNRPLKSLSDMLKGKQGRFRQNLLGKRVDYSGRSVIVVGPELEMHQCGLPRKMALELFKPFVMKELVEREDAQNIKQAKKQVERESEKVWDILEEVVKEHPVLLNRAPTLHRLGIQAFEPVLVDGKAIKLHPLVCTAYNADFDGDQMAVHVPLSLEAQAEARLLMMSTNNILNPKDGFPVATPTQDMVLGSYYLSVEKDGEPGDGKAFASYEEAMMAYEHKAVSLHARIRIRAEEDVLLVDSINSLGAEGKMVAKGELFETTLGRLIFNKEIPVPRELGYYNLPMDKKKLGQLIAESHQKLGAARTAQLLDGVKRMGYKYSTKAGLTISVADIDIPDAKEGILAETDKEVDAIEKLYKEGFCTEDERHEKVVELWSAATGKVTKAMMDNLNEFNPIYMMANSGARGNLQQIRQLAGMRGLMTDTSGKIVDLPIKANFREGLTVLEYFLSTHGARKGLADTALRTADSGYLTRRLVDVSQDVIITEEDCGDTEGFWVEEIKDGKRVIEPLKERIIGRFAIHDILHPETGEVLIPRDTLITKELAKKIEGLTVERVLIRSNFSCKSKHGVCAKCYGQNLATGLLVERGEAVGTVAAQSIGEPGTQLTMRTFHTGGVAGDDITQGLPRVEELFEARRPKGNCEVAAIAGEIAVASEKGRIQIRITGPRNIDGTPFVKDPTLNPNAKIVEELDKITATYMVPMTAKLLVQNGDQVVQGQKLTEGPHDLKDLLEYRGVDEVKNYILAEVQRVYRTQGVDINDKHIEIIVRQMMKKYRVTDSGLTTLLEGTITDLGELEEKNRDAEEPAKVKPVLLGITNASLATDSFLSAASFQETTKVLTEAAVKGKEDHLLGLKENVQIGKLIPTGTGFIRYQKLQVKRNGPVPAEAVSLEEAVMASDAECIAESSPE